MATQATLKWTNGLQFLARAENGPAVVLDTPDGKGGPTPMEMVLMGVAGCTAMDVISILTKKRQDVHNFEVNVSGQQVDEYPKRYSDIAIEYVVYGKAIDPKAVERAIALSTTKYCSAIASVNATISNSYRIVEDEK